MGYLDEFVSWLNEDVGGEGPLPNLKHGDYGTAMGDSLYRHYAEDRQRSGVRMSNIGKPAVLTALAKLGYTQPEPKGKSRLIFHFGDMFENWVEIMMQTYGIKVLESQPKYECMGITGHADYVIQTRDGQEVLVEAKTMSMNYSRMFRKEPDDNRGYVSQLAMYSKASGLPATWLCYDKGSSEVFEVVPDETILASSLERAEAVLARLENVNTLDDVLKQFRPPPPRDEIFKRELTGNKLVPMSMTMNPFRSAVYVLKETYNNYGKPVEYIQDVATTEHMKRELNSLVEKGIVSYAGA